jgi:hypothetical protein
MRRALRQDTRRVRTCAQFVFARASALSTHGFSRASVPSCGHHDQIEARLPPSGFFDQGGNIRIGSTGTFSHATPQGRDLDEVHQR